MTEDREDKHEEHDGHLVLSPSQIETFEDCERKWAHKHIAGLKPPPNKFAEFGLKVHEYLEMYERTGKPPDISTNEGKVALAAIKYIPEPGRADVFPEQQFDMQTRAGDFTGLMDLQYADPDGTWVVNDYKTTGDFKWALKPEAFEHNAQPLTYAAAAMALHDIDRVKLRWIYLKRDAKRPKAKVVERVLDLATVDRRIQRILDLGERMQALYRAKTPALSLPPTPASCEKYGGCPFKELCNLTPAERMRGYMKQGSLTAQMRAKVQQQQQSGGGTEDEEAPPPRRQQAQPASRKPAPRREPEPEQYDDPDAADADDGWGDHQQQQAAEDEAPPRGTRAAPRGAGTAVNPPPHRATSRAPAPRTQAATTRAPATRAPAQRQSAQQQDPHGAIEQQDFTLIVDAGVGKVPAGTEVITLDDIVQPIAAALAVTNNVAHYRLISNDFGVASSMLLVEVGQYMAANPLGAHVVVVADTQSLAAKDTLEVFYFLARTVIAS